MASQSGTSSADAVTEVGVTPASGSDRSIEPRQGQTVGRYHVLERAGAGGMGIVMRAYDPKLRREVALKLVRVGAERNEDESQPEARFLREAHAMARLNHPNVVSVFDVESIESTIVIVMEFVAGKTLHQWIEDDRPSTPRILEALRQAGRGLAAAHKAGIVHRDFKPANVLIGDDGRARVTDFGLARSRTGAKGTDSDVVAVDVLDGELTRAGTVMGTPKYMAPEQHRAVTATPASDQFSYCVTAYRSLCGEHPFSGTDATDLVAAKERGPDGLGFDGMPRRVAAAIRRGLAVEPHERWPSMDALLEALEDRRPWLPAVVLGGLAVAVLTAAGVTLWDEDTRACEGAGAAFSTAWGDQKRAAAREAFLQIEAGHAAEVWERVETELDDYAAAWIEMHRDACEDARVRREQSESMLDLRMSCLDERRRAAAALVTLFATADLETLDRAVDAVAALPGIDRCAELDALRAAVPPPEDRALASEVAEITEKLAHVEALYDVGRYEDALAEARPISDRAAALPYPPILARAAYLAAKASSAAAQHDAAERLLIDAYRAAVSGSDDHTATLAALELGMLYADHLERAEKAEQWLDDAQAWVERTDEAPKMRRILLMNRGLLAMTTGRYEEASTHYEQALALSETSFGPRHTETCTVHNNLGNALYMRGEYETAKKVLDRAVSCNRAALGPTHPRVARGLNNVGNALLELGKYEEAGRAYEQALAIFEASVGTEHDAVATLHNNLGLVRSHLEQNDKAVAHAKTALRIWSDVLGELHPKVAYAHNNLATFLPVVGEDEAGLASMLRALEIWEAAYGREHPMVGRALGNLAETYLGRGEYELAEKNLGLALEVLTATQGPDHPDMGYPLLNRARLELELGRDLRRAATDVQRATRLFAEHQGDDHPLVAQCLAYHAAVELELGHHDKARELAERSVAVVEPLETHPELRGLARFQLARALWPDRSQRGRALQLARDALPELEEARDERTLKRARAWLSSR